MARHQTGTLQQHRGAWRARIVIVGKRQTIALGTSDRGEAARRLAVIVARLASSQQREG